MREERIEKGRAMGVHETGEKERGLRGREGDTTEEMEHGRDMSRGDER